MAETGIIRVVKFTRMNRTLCCAGLQGMHAYRSALVTDILHAEPATGCPKTFEARAMWAWSQAIVMMGEQAAADLLQLLWLTHIQQLGPGLPEVHLDLLRSQYWGALSLTAAEVSEA